MKKLTAVQLSIPEPCTQAWDEMQSTDGGRYCGRCEKTVIDFTSMSDEALIEFLRHQKGAFCGRMREDQLSRPLYQPVPLKGHMRYWPAIISTASLLIGLNQTAGAQIRSSSKSPQANAASQLQISVPDAEYPVPDELVENCIKGVVLDQKGEHLPNAEVILLDPQTKKTLARDVADFDGNYKLVLPDGTPSGLVVDLQCSYELYDITIMGITIMGGEMVQNITMGIRTDLVAVGAITAYPVPPRPAYKPEMRTINLDGLTGVNIAPKPLTRWERIKQRIRRML